MKIFKPAVRTDSDTLSWLMVGMGVLLLVIWPMMETIALRNILIFLGGSIGLWYVVRERASLYQKPALPLLFILLLLGWIGAHFFFFSQDAALELRQIKSTWLRVLFACFLGVGTGLFARNRPRAQQAVWAGFVLFIVVFFVNYAWGSFSLGQWAIPYPQPYNFGVYGNKLGTVFYGMILLALCCGVIAYQFAHMTAHKAHTLLAAIACIVLTFLAFVIADTKNGVALGLMLILPLVFLFLLTVKKSWINVSIASIFLILICLASYLHLKNHPEWRKVFSTVAIGMQISTYPNWQNRSIYGLPQLADGSVVHESVYYRAALATEGLKLFRENPLGYGVVDISFKYLAERDLPRDSNIGFVGTHSGWLDFALGYGLPGLLLIWAAMASAVFYSFRREALWSYASRWILAGAFITWIFAEVSSSHFVETLFYLIALLAAGNLGVSEKRAAL